MTDKIILFFVKQYIHILKIIYQYFDEKLISSIIVEAISHTTELPWIELKSNNSDPQMIGE